jgi:large subunit ribosomal protein L23
MNRIIIKPIITEKSISLAAKGTFVFAVALLANKKQIAAEVHTLYGVHVEDVHTISMHGKSKRIGKRATVKPAVTWKKAMVRVKKGESIDAFEMKTDEKQTA